MRRSVAMAPQDKQLTSRRCTAMQVNVLEGVHRRGWIHNGLDLTLIRYGARFENQSGSRTLYLTGFHGAVKYAALTDADEPPVFLSMYGGHNNQYKHGGGTCCTTGIRIAGPGGLVCVGHDR